MEILFIFVYIIVNELTYSVAVNQSEGLVRHISAGDLCWIARIVLIIPCIYYCGWIVGIILTLFTLFGIVHMTVGWILAIPNLFVKNDRQVLRLVELECNLLVPMDILLIIFTIISFFVASYKSVLTLFDSNKKILFLVIVLVICSLSRIIVSKFVLKNIE